MYLRVLNELYLLYNIYTIKVQNIKKFIIHLYAASGATSDQYLPLKVVTLHTFTNRKKNNPRHVIHNANTYSFSFLTS
jgi:hypothetical protein